MALDILVLYGSYRSHRMGIRLADYLIGGFEALGHRAELVDAKAVDLPMLDLRHSDYPPGQAPGAMAKLAQRLSAADAFVFVAGEYNRGLQPGLKNLVDHYLTEFDRRPAGIASYSAGRFAGVNSHAAWTVTLNAMGMVVIPERLSVGQIGDTLDEAATPQGPAGAALERGFKAFAESLTFWAEAAKARR
ncbi:NAD(P)H-dependent FMN reductase [Sphingobium sp. OAS761]|uniref:NADPH-dependent FMN reductase n=1 Tax=Sphingobium sp. OAS761 TaxID=2817901 RepID=UPI00209CDB0C|nr:NAD(P)H-dependent oxidoreductase [Sphingobium sp. OAS761]MCP1469075.1 NAD(P)H-dependent FMN reductase [Sphingobium sp. OAS761]